MTSTKIDNSQDLIDSRDVIARIAELGENWEIGGDDFETADLEELKALKALAEEAKDYAPDWEHGETLIRDTYFQEYAQELAEDCGLLENCNKWPATCIDWKQAAEELQQDYTEVDFDGRAYWIR